MAGRKAGRKAVRGPGGRPARESAPNPFESRLGVKKDDVLGRKRKHGREKKAGARDQGLEKRKSTLLVEYKLRNKGNSFVDRRIGEHDNTLSEDDKAIARFQRQRFKDMLAEQGARSTGKEEPLFGFGSRPDAQIADDLEEDDLGEDAEDSGDERDADGGFGGGFVRKEAGEAEPEEEPQKSKKQVMEELIAKSKAFKAEKAKQRDADLDETEALDRDLNDLLQTGALHTLLKKKGAAPAKQPLDDEEQAYDKDRRGLIFEAKAKAGEKLNQQPGEQSAAEAEAAEEPRQALESGDADVATAQLPAGGYALRRAKKRQREQEEGLAAAGDDDGSEEDGSDSESSESGADVEKEPGVKAQHQLEAAVTSRLQQADAGTTLASSTATTEPPARPGRGAMSGFPASYELYLADVEQLSPAELDAALRALRSLARKAAAEDGRRLQVLCGYEIQHFAHRAGASPPPMEELDVLTAHIAELCAEVPLYAISAAQARLARLQQRLSLTLSAPEDEEGEQTGERGWPSQRQLLLLKLWLTVFPSAERRHHVLTPLSVVVAGFLKLCPVTSLQDVKAGLFLCSIALQLAESTKRIMPELLEFSGNVLRHAAGAEAPASGSSPSVWTLQLPGTRMVQPAGSLLSWGAEQKPQALWASCISAAIGVVAQSAKLFGEAESFPEMFAPAALLLDQLGRQKLPGEVDVQRQQACSAIRRQMQQVEQNRRPLQKDKVVKEVKQFNPRFEEDYAAGKSYDPDRVRADERKLKRKLGKEQRSAVRELRKDAVFLGDEVAKERRAEEQERKGALRKNTAWLQSQEADFKSGGQGGLWKKRKRR